MVWYQIVGFCLDLFLFGGIIYLYKQNGNLSRQTEELRENMKNPILARKRKGKK
jgi:hypothetical protein